MPDLIQKVADFSLFASGIFRDNGWQWKDKPEAYTPGVPEISVSTWNLIGVASDEMDKHPEKETCYVSQGRIVVVAVRNDGFRLAIAP